MGQILIRNLDDNVISSLKVKAELAGKSLEQSLRDLLTAQAPLTPDERVAASRRLREGCTVEHIDIDAAIDWGRNGDKSDESPAW